MCICKRYNNFNMQISVITCILPYVVIYNMHIFNNIASSIEKARNCPDNEMARTRSLSFSELV